MNPLGTVPPDGCVARPEWAWQAVRVRMDREGERPVIRLFGGIGAEVAGAEVDLGGPKQRLILALLALEPDRVVPVDRIVESVWAERAPARAEVSVRGYISNLRKEIPGLTIQWRDLGYVMGGGVEVDLLRFEELVRTGRLQVRARQLHEASNSFGDALGLWTGPPFGAYAESLPVAEVVARLHELRGEAVEARFELRLLLGEHRELVADVGPEISQHPFREGLRVQLALAYYRSGRPVEALRAIEDARRTLVEEVGVDPGPELRAVEASILAQDPSLDWVPPPGGGEAAPGGTAASHERTSAPHSPPPAAPSPLAEAPAAPASVAATPADGAAFVGRESELAALTAALEGMAAGATGRALVVGGDPGIGKTTLVRRLADLARGAGHVVAWSRCPESAAVSPYWPWQMLAADLLDAGVDLRPALDTSAGRGAESDDGAHARLRTHAAVASALRGAGGPCLLVVDDLQWADAATLALIEFLAGELSNLPIALAVTVRSADARIADARSSDVRSTATVLGCLAELSRAPGSVRVELTGLERSEVDEWLSATLGDRSSSGLASIVHDRTDGNPFFVREMIALLDSEGPAQAPLSAEAATAVPAAVQDVVRRRASRLDPDVQRLLTVAAVVGRRFDVDVVADVAGRSLDDTLDLLEVALGAGLLEPDGSRPGRLAFAHALIAETLVAELNPIRSARLHAGTTVALERRWEGNLDHVVQELAHHAYLGASAGTAAEAVDYSARAAAAAMRAHAPTDAALHLERALAALELHAPGDVVRRMELLTELGIARGDAADLGAGRAALLDAATLAESIGHLAGSVRALGQVHADDLWTGHDWDVHDGATMSLVERTLAKVPENDQASRAQLLAALARQAFSLDPRRSSGLAADAVHAAEQVGDPRLLFRALLQRYWVEWRGGGTAVRAATADRMLEVVAGGGVPEHFTPLSHLARFSASYELGDPADVEHHLALARATADPVRTRAAWSYVLYGEVSLRLLRGEVATLESQIGEMHAAFRRSRAFVADVVAAGVMAQLRVEQGRVDDALQLISQLLASGWSPSAWWSRAWAAAESGRDDEAAVSLAGFEGRLPDDRFRMPHFTAGIHAASLIGDREFVARHVESLRIDSGLVACTGSGGVVLGPVDLALARAEHLLGNDDRASTYVDAAVEVATRMGARPWLDRAERLAAQLG